jgi:hypothetical protein
MNPTIFKPISALSLPAGHPEYVPLRVAGGDAVCNLSRSFWYKAERAGLIQLTRVRLPGRRRVRVLLPVLQAIALLQKLGAHSSTEIEFQRPLVEPLRQLPSALEDCAAKTQ